MIGQSIMLSFYRTKKNKCLGHREPSWTKKTRLFTLSRSVKGFVVSLLLDQLAQLEGTVNASLLTFSWKQVQERQNWGGSTIRPGAAETAASFMGSGVSRSHERRSIKFCLRHSGVSSAVRELPLRSSPEWVYLRLRHSGVSSAVRKLPLRSSPEWVCLRLHLSPSSSLYIFVCLCHSARWLIQRASAVCPMFNIEGLDTAVACTLI